MADHIITFRRYCLLHEQVNVKDAFELCRYDWMCQALERFLRVLTKEAKLEAIGESPESPLPTDVVADSPVVLPSCCINAPTAQRHQAIIPFSWIVTMKRLPLT